MGFIDNLYWLWVCMPLILKILFFILFALGLFSIFLSFIQKEMTPFFYGVGLSVCVVLASFSLFSLTTETLVSMYENGDIDKREFEAFLPYAIEKDKEDARDREERNAEKNREKEALKILEEKKAKRKEEAEGLVKKFKEEE